MSVLNSSLSSWLQMQAQFSLLYQYPITWTEDFGAETHMLPWQCFLNTWLLLLQKQGFGLAVPISSFKRSLLAVVCKAVGMAILSVFSVVWLLPSHLVKDNNTWAFTKALSIVLISRAVLNTPLSKVEAENKTNSQNHQSFYAWCYGVQKLFLARSKRR